MNDGTCKARTTSGAPCRAKAVKKGLCSLHADPSRAAYLGRESGRARRLVVPVQESQPEMRPPRTAVEVRDLLGQALCDVRQRRLDHKVASTLGYLSSVLLKSIEVSDVEERVAALEAVLKTKGA
jgi:hypothetical protein